MVFVLSTGALLEIEESSLNDSPLTPDDFVQLFEDILNTTIEEELEIEE
ncbi:hypothetical protein ACTS9E_15090 [Empedobacter brevis]